MNRPSGHRDARSQPAFTRVYSQAVMTSACRQRRLGRVPFFFVRSLWAASSKVLENARVLAPKISSHKSVATCRARRHEPDDRYSRTCCLQVEAGVKGQTDGAGRATFPAPARKANTHPWRRSEKSQQSLSRSGPRKESRFLEGVGHQPPQLRWVAGRRTMPGAGRGPGRTPRGQPRVAQSCHLESPRPTGRRSTSAIRQVGHALRRTIHNSIQTTLRLKAASLLMTGALGWDGWRGQAPDRAACDNSG